jgi:hypothetical protein
MGTRNGAESVKLNKMQVTMNKTRSLDGISTHWLTCMQPNTCNMCQLHRFTLYWKNNVKEFVEIQNTHRMVYSITCIILTL